MKKILLNIFLLIGFVVSSTQVFASPVDNAQDAYFISLSDIHFDPFIPCYNIKQRVCPIIESLRNAPVSAWPAIFAKNDRLRPAYHLDTGYPLFASALNSAGNIKQQPIKFAVILGDFLGHDYRKYYKKYANDPSSEGYQEFVSKTMQFISQDLSKTFPTIDVFPVVGNNDTYQRDYASDINGAFFKETGRDWLKLIKNKKLQQQFYSQFKYAGYYALTLPSQPNIKLIAMNTVLFSTKAKGNNISSAAEQELRWLHQELQDAKDHHQRVMITMHIPVGIDVYATLRIKLFTLIEFWKPVYSKEFKAQIAQFAPEIAGIFAGHLHSDYFQILTLNHGNDEVVVTGTPSVSPINGNNPGFKVYRYTTNDIKVDDYYTYYLPIDNNQGWNLEYDFNQIYQPRCHSCSLLDGMRMLRERGDLANSYIQYYAVGTDSQPITTQFSPYYWCAVNNASAKKYQRCIIS